MRKVVNGVVVEIDNLGLFEKAAEDIAINRTVINNTLDITIETSDTLNEIVTLYSKLYKSLPYPLYGIDCDLKYVTLGQSIKNVTNITNDMWVRDGLMVRLDSNNNTLHFINNTWEIIQIEQPENWKDIKEYKNELGYKEYCWVLDRLSNNNKTTSFYHVHMKDFVKACNNQPVILKWELGDILNFSSVPEKLELKNDNITDIQENMNYFLDVFIAGKKKTQNTKTVWNLVDGTETTETMYSNKYNFDLYKKDIVADKENVIAGSDRINKCDISGFTGLFITLLGIRKSVDNSEFTGYTGIVADDKIIYEIDKRVFVNNLRAFKASTEIARGVEIYSYDSGLLYMSKSVKLKAGIFKETIYSYNLNDDTLRLCRVRFINK